MKSIILLIAVLTTSNFALAESAWDIDSCLESIIRQFTCTIDGKEVTVDLEAQSTKMSHKVPSLVSEKVYGIFVHNVDGGELYITCDDAGSMKKKVQYSKNDSLKLVSCK